MWQRAHGPLAAIVVLAGGLSGWASAEIEPDAGSDRSEAEMGVWPPLPLFPGGQAHAAMWTAAMRSTPARARFQAQLPAGVVLMKDDCISIPNRTAFNQRFVPWLQKAGTPLDQFWQPGRQLFVDLERDTRSWARAYMLGSDAIMVERQTADHHSPHEICLVPIGPRLRQELQARVERRATCWAGDLQETLLHPRTLLPAERRFASVAVGPTRTCAIDDSGTPSCCGARLEADIPAGAFAAVAVGRGFDCGLTREGDMRCWGRDAPAGGAIVPGPFSKIAVGDWSACAIRRSGGALECWFGDKRKPVTVSREGIRDVRVLVEGLCALTENGRIFCRGPDVSKGWVDVDGRYRAFAASKEAVCGVTAAGDGIRCWKERWNWWMSAPMPDPDAPPKLAGPAGPSDVALAGSDGCVLARSGDVFCWGARAAARWSNRYRTIVGTEGRLCALTVDGRVECDRDWPANGQPYE